MPVDKSCAEVFRATSCSVNAINSMPNIKCLYEKPEISIFSMNTIRGNPAGGLYEDQGGAAS